MKTANILFTILFFFTITTYTKGEPIEKLDRGLIALKGDSCNYISWRLLSGEKKHTYFNIYRKEGNNPPIKLNKKPLKKSTFFTDSTADNSKNNTYFIKTVRRKRERAQEGLYTIKAGSKSKNYISIPLKTPHRYHPGDCSVGDLDGDGKYEIIVHMIGIRRDNSHSGLTTDPILQAYKLNGTFMWEINLGKNIREGAHYTQFLVYDFDGDGKAEIMCKTADGTIDGEGNIIGDSTADWRTLDKTGNKDPWKNYRPFNFRFSHYKKDFKNMPNKKNRHQRDRYTGRIFDGPEYLTVFEGSTGKALKTVNYIPGRGERLSWGDDNANRSERYLAGVAYLDGKHPSAVFCRGYYTRSVLVAWDWKNGELTRRWTFDSYKPGNEAYSGQGCHSLSIADVDGDGCDEIIYGACTINNDGTGLYSTGKGHGDALHCSDLDPTRKGLEVFMVHEKMNMGADVAAGDFRDAKTGKLLWGIPGTEDIGRGMCADIDPRYPGYECWSLASGGLISAKGKKITNKKPRSCNFAIWWDGDLLRDLLDRNYISKWNYREGRDSIIFRAAGCRSINGTKATPNLSADLFGDWREEVIFRTLDNKELRIYSTTIPTKYRFTTLMQDRQYRESIAWQNVGYNQPPHPGFYLGSGMKKYKKH